MSILGRWSQKAAETLDYDVDYTVFFSSRTDGIQSVTATGSSALTISSPVITGNIVKILVSGGVDKSSYQITMTLTTSTQVVKVDTFFITISEGAAPPGL